MSLWNFTVAIAGGSHAGRFVPGPIVGEELEGDRIPAPEMHTDPQPAGVRLPVHAIMDAGSGYGQRGIPLVGYGPELGVVLGLPGVRIVQHVTQGRTLAQWRAGHHSDHVGVVALRGWTPQALLWVPGTADAELPIPAAATQAQMLGLVAQARASWGPGLLIAIAEQPDHASLPYAAVSRAGLAAAASGDSRTHIIDTSDLVRHSGGIGWDGPSQVLLGRRFGTLVRAM